MTGIGQDPGGFGENVIEVSGLSRRFGARDALRDVSLRVPRGLVYGLVGENGAGKTTLMRHLMGLMTPQEGTVRLFGLDPVRDPVGVLGRIGYLSEERDLPDWMTVGEAMAYTAGFYPKWDVAYAERLRANFRLARNARVKALSRGERAKLGLLLALAHRPELLLLDEPSSGLDPVVRRAILESIVRTAADEGRTVLLSSHLLDEVERMCDRMAMMVDGRIVLEGAVDAIKSEHRTLALRFAEATEEAPQVTGMAVISGAGRVWNYVTAADGADAARAAGAAGAEVAGTEGATLDDIFVARCAAAAAARDGAAGVA